MVAAFDTSWGDGRCSKILLAVDGSESAVRAARKLIETADWYKEPPTVELVAVHLPVPVVGFADVVVSREMIERYYQEEGEKMLAAVRRAARRGEDQVRPAHSGRADRADHRGARARIRLPDDLHGDARE